MPRVLERPLTRSASGASSARTGRGREASDDGGEDIRRAARWEELAPPGMRHLLDAEPVNNDEPSPSAKIRTEWPKNHGDRRSRARSTERSAEEGMVKPGTIDRDNPGFLSGCLVYKTNNSTVIRF